MPTIWKFPSAPRLGLRGAGDQFLCTQVSEVIITGIQKEFEWTHGVFSYFILSVLILEKKKYSNQKTKKKPFESDHKWDQCITKRAK